MSNIVDEQIAEDARFEEANKKVHPVEGEWHYPIMARYGFAPETKEAVGFVRSYEYRHPSGHTIVVTTGVSSDYWKDQQDLKTGYWLDLESHLKSLELPNDGKLLPSTT